MPIRRLICGGSRSIGGRRPGMPGHADAEHEQVAEPERQPGDEADLCDVDRGQPIVRIDAEADRAAGKHRRADVVADRVAREARQRRDAIRDVLLADRAQREEIIKGQREERPDDAKRGERDLDAATFRSARSGSRRCRRPSGSGQECDHSQDDDEKLAAIPSRFQPILSLKPRCSAVSSRCIRPPGRAITREGLSWTRQATVQRTVCEDP